MTRLVASRSHQLADGRAGLVVMIMVTMRTMDVRGFAVPMVVVLTVTVIMVTIWTMNMRGHD